MKFILEERFILCEDTTNWEQEYAKCKDSDDFKNFWEKYYRNVWRAQAEAIKKIGIETCLPAYGWTEIENPLLAFLHEIIKPINGVGLSTITRADFKMLTTAFERKLLSKEDFILKGKLKGFNLIFNPHFYTDIADSDSQLDYLRLQKNFKNPVGSDGKALDTSWWGNAFANLYSVTGNPENLMTKVKAGDKLRDFKQLTRLSTKVVPGIESKTVEKATSDTVSAYLEHISDTDAKTYFVSAFDTFEISKPESITYAEKKTVAGPKLTDYRETISGIDHDAVKEAGKKLKITSGSYSIELAARLLIGLANKAGARITVETTD